MATYDPFSGLLSNKKAQPDYDPTGRQNISFTGGLPGAGISPSGSASYANLLRLPGSMPDFMGILNSDPLLQQARSGLGAQSISDRAQLTAAQSDALVRFGLIPEGLQGDFATPETRTLADTNTAEGLSTVGRLQREFERVQQNIMDALAARGALRSGATGVALQDLQQDKKVAMSDAETQLMDYFKGLQRGFADAERQRAMQLSGEQQAAAGRIDPSRLAGSGGIEATHVGNGIYKSPDGRLWNADGTPYAGAAPAPAPAPLPPPPPLVRAPQFSGGGRLSEYAQ